MSQPGFGPPPGGPPRGGPRRPYPSTASYGVNSPASLAGPQMPPPGPPGSQQPVRHPAAPIIANPGAGMQGQLPSMPQPAPAQPQTPRNRIDPDLMPNPLTVQKADVDQYEGKQWVTSTPGVPPLVTTDIPILDMGNSSPRFIRSCFYTVPSTKDIANQVNMPMSK